MGVHDGHRERLKGQFLAHGLDGLTDVNVLELLLFFAIPRRDTNELAHALLDRFGSLEAIFDASESELESVPQIGKNAATLIRLLPAVMRRCEISRTRSIQTITGSSDAARFFLPRLRYEKDELLLLLCLDSQKRVLSCTEVARGSLNEVKISVRKIVETAVKDRARSVILAHNHPDGAARPSKEDELTTRRIVSALKLVDIPVDDHIVVGNDEYCSFAQCGLLNDRRYI